MAISISSIKRSSDDGSRPPILAFYGTHGIGKTSLAAGAPAPVMLQTEDGLGMIDVPTFGMLSTFQEVLDAITSLADDPHDFQTAIIDSVDWLQPTIYDYVCTINNWDNIESPGYGKGYKVALETWRLLISGLRHLRDARGMGIILISHSEIHRISPPDGPPYDRYQPKLQKDASEIMQEAADGVFFMNYHVTMLRDDPADKKSRQRASGGGSRILYTTERPTHLGKNRWQKAGMPDQIRLPDDADNTWGAVAQHIPFYNQNKKDS